MMMKNKYFNIISNVKSLNPLIFIMFLMILQKAEGGIEKPTESIKNSNESEIAIQNNIIFHYDFSNLNSYNRQTTTENNKTINDLSGNNNYGTVRIFQRYILILKKMQCFLMEKMMKMQLEFQSII